MRRQRAENSKWRRGLAELCGYLPRGMYGLEIGSLAGELADMFVKLAGFDALFCVDPWEKTSTRDDTGESGFDAVAARHPEIIKCKGYLQDFYRSMPPLDFIYIDAKHQHVETFELIFQSLLLAKEPCLLAGHDYNERKHPGLVRAVNTIFAGHLQDVIRFVDWSFLVGIRRHRGGIETYKPRLREIAT